MKYDYNINPDLIEKNYKKTDNISCSLEWKNLRNGQNFKNSKENSLHIVEDACHAITATYKKTFAGKFGDFGCFSFTL